MKNYPLFNNVQIPAWAILGSFFVVVLMYYLIGPEIDRTICYERLSNDLDVPPTSSSIRAALHSVLSSKSKLGFTYDQVIETLENNWHYKIIWRRPGLEGGFKEYVLLEQCYFSRNDFTFLFVFSKDGNLTDILNYIDD